MQTAKCKRCHALNIVLAEKKNYFIFFQCEKQEDIKKGNLKIWEITKEKKPILSQLDAQAPKPLLT